MDILIAIILTVVCTIGLMSVAFVVYEERKAGNKDIPWEKIRPILSEMFVEAIKLIQAKGTGYQAVEDYAVSFVKRKIDNAGFLLPQEKEILTEDFIRGIIAPRLKELYAKEQGRI